MTSSGPPSRRSSSRGALAVDVPDEVVVERPKNPEHGDYATNIALRLAKAAGRPPREVAELLAEELRAQPGIAAVDVAGPGFLNITLAQGALGQIAVQAVTAGARLRAHRRPGRAAAQPGVRLGQPDRAGAHRRTRWAAVGDALGPAAGGQRRRGQPRVLLQRRRRADRPVRPQPAGRGARPAGARGRVPGRLHRDDRRSRCVADRPRAARPARGRAGRRSSPSRASRRWSPRSAARSTAFGVALRHLLLREDAARVRRAGEGAGPAARAGARLRGRRRGLAADDGLRRRQGPGAGQGRRRADLLRRRLRLLPGQAGPRLRQGRDHARRRPLRLRRPVQGAGRGRRRRPGDAPGDPDRPAGQPGPRRRAGADEQAGRQRRRCSTTSSTRSASTRPGTRWPGASVD